MPQSALGKTLNYVKEQWPYLCNYLKDGRLELSNNRVERSIKLFVVDRKNYLFANTPNGARGSAVIFSLMHMAIENSLDPYCYQIHAVEDCEQYRFGKFQICTRFLPWNAQKESRIKGIS